MRKTLPVIMLLLALTVPNLSVFAQDTITTHTITEAEINSLDWVTAPENERFSDVAVDLQPGQMVITATYQPRSGDALAIGVTLVPDVAEGFVQWTVVSLLADGEPASDEVTLRVNTALTSLWVRYWREKLDLHLVESITITEDDLTYVVDLNAVAAIERPADPIITRTEDAVTVTFTEAQVNESFLVGSDCCDAVTDVIVDLQPGQAVVSATFNLLRGDAVAVLATLVPAVIEGQVEWQATSILIDGAPAAEGMLTRINTVLIQAWDHYWRRNVNRFQVVQVVVEELAIVFEVEPRLPAASG